MPHRAPTDLSTFDLAGMLRTGLALRHAIDGSASIEAAAGRVCRWLYDELAWRDGARQCALVRFYVTLPLRDLPPEVRAFAERAAPAPLDSGTRCLTLLATVGDEPAWNDRRRSRGHQAIPLASERIIEEAPMIAQLLRQFGVDVAALIAPSPDVVADLLGKTYGVFHVEEALGSPFIPAQQEFVVPHGIRSVVGFGGTMRTGDLFAAILFTRVHVSRDAAERFRNVALDVKSALFLLESGAVFESEAAVE